MSFLKTSKKQWRNRNMRHDEIEEKASEIMLNVCSKHIDYDPRARNDAFDCAVQMGEWMQDELIEKASKYLIKTFGEYVFVDNNKLIEDFKKYMEG